MSKTGKLMTVKEVAEQLGVSEKTVRREYREGKLDYCRVRGLYRFSPKAVDAYEARRNPSRRRVPNA